jgi:hypothetical protein
MTTTNTDLVRAISIAGPALSAMPLDDLPRLAGVEFREHADRRGAELRVSAQVCSTATRSTADAVRALLAWQGAMPGHSALRALRLRDGDQEWQVTARGHLGGIWGEVWAIVQPDAATDARMVDAGSDISAAAVLVQSVNFEPAAGPAN